jgi:hypothetical protein
MTDWWSYPTNFSNATTIEGPSDLFIKFPSFILNNWFGDGIIIMIWLMAFGLSIGGGSRKALMTSSFIAFVFSVFLFRLGALHGLVCIILIALTVVGAIGSKDEAY